MHGGTLRKKISSGHERDLTRNQFCWYLDIRLYISVTVRSGVPLVKPPSLWHFVMSSLDNEFQWLGDLTWVSRAREDSADTGVYLTTNGISISY